MIWVLIALIALLILAVPLYLFVFRWNRLARHGSVEVPGESLVELPDGPVEIYYEDAFKWRYSERAKPGPGFSMLVSDERSGERIDLDPPEAKTTFKARGKNRIPYGLLTLPRAGRYRVESRIDADAVNPRITFG
jgi:hypothetical protein